MTEPITLADEIECVSRELKLRRNAYPRFVSSRRMSQDKADYEIAVMERIMLRLQRLQQEQLSEPSQARDG